MVCLLELILVLIRRYDDIYTRISVDLIQTLLLFFKEGRFEPDIIYPIGKVISCYVLRLTSITSVLLNPLLSFLQSVLPNSDVLVDSLQTIATPSSSLIVFEQFLLYIAGHKQYASCASSFLDWYLRMPQYSTKFIEKLLVEQPFLYRPTASLLKVVLQSEAIHENPHLTHSILHFVITTFKSNEGLFHIIDLITQATLTQKLAVDTHIWFLLCRIGLTAMSRSELVMEKTGRFLYTMMKLLIKNQVECDERIHRCLRCVFSRCYEDALKDLLSVKIVQTSFEGEGVIAQCIKSLDDQNSSLMLIQSTEIPPELGLMYLFSNQASIVQSILSTSHIAHHSLISVFL